LKFVSFIRMENPICDLKNLQQRPVLFFGNIDFHCFLSTSITPRLSGVQNQRSCFLRPISAQKTSVPFKLIVGSLSQVRDFTSRKNCWSKLKFLDNSLALFIIMGFILSFFIKVFSTYSRSIKSG
jgi:hypothetical protein